MITRDDMQSKGDNIVDIYSQLEQDIFKEIINTISKSAYENVDKDNVILWQMEQLSKMGSLTKAIVKMVAKASGLSEKAINELVIDNGMQVRKEMDQKLQRTLNYQPHVTTDTHKALNAIRKQTFSNLNNYVNQSLITRNYGKNGADLAFESIVKQSTAEVISGLKTHEQAVKDNVYKWVDNGLNSAMVDKGGHQWSLEGYTRTVINTTTHRTFNQARMDSMDDYDVTLVVMDAHAASREACAPIQGHVVNRVPMSDPRYNRKYDSLYNHDYGKPGGTQGVNCGHNLDPFIEGVNTNFYKPVDPEQAIENSKIQQKQRYYERQVRANKKKLAAAQEFGDTSGIALYKGRIADYQGKLREHVQAHEFLSRDYSREQVYSKITKNYSVTRVSDSQRHTATKLRNGEWGKKINPDKQAPHMELTRAANKSYFHEDVDPQKLLDKYSGTGELNITKSGKYGNKELIHADKPIGIDGNSGEETEWFVIHHSAGRTHLTPVKRKK